MALAHPLPPGPLDIIGDVHGELGALEALLAHLAEAGRTEQRHLVFVGDLVDRGPDSLGVVRLVERLMHEGRASCLVGNHELNLLLGKRRSGNEWFYGEEQPLRSGVGVLPQVLADDHARTEVMLFLQRLPLAMEREDLRVAHACWHEPALETLAREELSGLGVIELFYRMETEITRRVMDEGHPPDGMIANLARQNENPVTALTSGLEHPTAEPFHAGGSLRHVERIPWWQEYRDEVPVVFGHFWRALDPTRRAVRNGPYLFGDEDFHDALGPRRNAYCIDYSVGYRHIGRTLMKEDERPTALMALRWPERELIDDDGNRWPVRH